MITTATGFDTLAYARRLKAAGVCEEQAEAHAEAVRDAVTEGVATKAVMAAPQSETASMRENMATKTYMAGLDAETANLRSEICRVMWLRTGVIIGANTGLTFALLRLFPPS